MVFYFAGQGVQGMPTRLRQKRDLGLFLDRFGILHDLALIMEDETYVPVAKMQSILANLHGRVKRKLLILDTRLAKPR